MNTSDAIVFDLAESICKLDLVDKKEQKALKSVSVRNDVAARILAAGDEDVTRLLEEIGATCPRTQMSAIRDALMRVRDFRVDGDRLQKKGATALRPSRSLQLLEPV